MNAAGIALIKQFEGCKLEAYPDPVTKGDPWTIGYGATFYPDGQKVKKGDKITQEKADEMLAKRLDKLATQLDRILYRDVNENQFSALMSLAYNIGLAALERSTLLGCVNAGQFEPAASEFLRWDKAKVDGIMITVKGLYNRRVAERDLFRKDIKP